MEASLQTDFPRSRRRVAVWSGAASPGAAGVSAAEMEFSEAEFRVESFAPTPARNNAALRAALAYIVGCRNAAITVRIEGWPTNNGQRLIPACMVTISVRVPVENSEAQSQRRLRAIVAAFAAEGVRLATAPASSSTDGEPLGWVEEIAELVRAERSIGVPGAAENYGFAAVYSAASLPRTAPEWDGHEILREISRQAGHSRCAVDVTLCSAAGLTDLERQAAEEYCRLLSAWAQPRTLRTSAGVFSQERSMELPALPGVAEAAERVRALVQTIAGEGLLVFGVRCLSEQAGGAALLADRYLQCAGLGEALAPQVVRAQDSRFAKALAAVRGGYCSPAVASAAWNGGVAPVVLQRFHRLVQANEALSMPLLPCGSDRGPVPHIQKAAKDASKSWTLSRALAAEPFWQADSRKGIEAPFAVMQGDDRPEWQTDDLVRLIFNDKTPHGLVGGKSGSGKSKLLHALIASLCHRYSPDELVLYLVDLKEGVEFITYRHLPHVVVLAVESDRELAVEVLKGVRDEMLTRGTAFRKAEVSHIKDFRQARKVTMPRIVLIVDEFQVLFEPGPQGEFSAGAVASLLEQIAARGRNAGVHMLLSTQSYLENGGVWLTGATLSNSPLRLCMQLLNAAQASRLLQQDPDDILKLKQQGEVIVEDNGRGRDHAFARALFEPDDESYGAVLNGVVKRSRAGSTGGNRKAPMVFEGSVLPGLDAGLDAAEAAGEGTLFFGQHLDVAGTWAGITFSPYALSHTLLVGSRSEQTWMATMCAVLTFLRSSPSGSVSIATLMPPPKPIEAALVKLRAVGGDRLKYSVGEPALVKLVLTQAAEVKAPADGAEPQLVVLIGAERGRAWGNGPYSSTPEKEALFELIREGAAASRFLLVCAFSWQQLTGILQAEQLDEFGLRVGLSLPDAIAVVKRQGEDLDLPLNYGVCYLPTEGTVRRFRLPEEAAGLRPLTPNNT